VTQQKSSGQDKANIPSLISRARELRHSDTLAEKLAWRLLRNANCFTTNFAANYPSTMAL
jgi:very-short-patch-repair endonuclease